VAATVGLLLLIVFYVPIMEFLFGAAYCLDGLGPCAR